MPRQTLVRRRRRYARRRRTRRPYKRRLNLSRQVKKIKKEVATIKKNVEYKQITAFYDDTSLADGAINTYALLHTNGASGGIGQGVDNIDQRIGNKVTVKSLGIRYQLNSKPAVSADTYLCQSVCFRVIIFLDRNPQGSAYDPNYLLDSNYTTPPTKARRLILGFYNNLETEYKGRFNILYDKWHVMNQKGPGGAILKNIFINKPFEIRWTDADSDGSSYSKNKPYILFVRDDSASSGEIISMRWISKCVYADS